jgi:hypothetical protein
MPNDEYDTDILKVKTKIFTFKCLKNLRQFLENTVASAEGRTAMIFFYKYIISPCI